MPTPAQGTVASSSGMGRVLAAVVGLAFAACGDNLRPAPAFTLDFRGSVSRLNNFLNSGFLFNSDIATDSDNVWNDGPTVDAHVYQGWVHDYYFKRYGRPRLLTRLFRTDQAACPDAYRWLC